jgi:DNA-binding response OmpR family regulator
LHDDWGNNLVEPAIGNDLRGGFPRPQVVLLVDSDSRLMNGFAEALRADGYAVFEAATFEDGRRLCSKLRPDVLVVDVRLGQFNGLQLLMRARSEQPNIHAIITCPFTDPVLEAETRRFGGTFLTKPLAPWQILEAVRNSPSRTGPVPAPHTPPSLIERRRSDRRRQQLHLVFPDRRSSDRRGNPKWR